MRMRLFLSFVLIALISVFTVVIVARQHTTTAVRAFMVRGGMIGEEGLLDALVSYYQTNQSWQGVQSLLHQGGRGQGHGMGAGGMMQGTGSISTQRLRIADTQGYIVGDTANIIPSGVLSADEKESAIAIQVDGKTVGYLFAEGGMAFSRKGEIELVDRLTRSAMTAGLITVGFSLLLALVLAYSLLHPVRELTNAAQKLGEGDLSQRVRIKGHDELTILAKTFNNMADSLQKSEESRRSMTADIAHELRNPLAVQRANLEALQDGVYPLTAESLEPVLSQNLILTHLVDDLRTLALADSGRLTLECRQTDLIKLLKQLIERYQPQAVQQQVNLRFQINTEVATPLFVNVDPLRLDQIVSNLLSNALQYTPSGGEVTVDVHVEAKQAVISVHDSGPGIPQEALPHIFERFYRTDRSRSRLQGGTGLGLTIARQLAEAHSGTLTASNHPDGGALFSLRLLL